MVEFEETVVHEGMKCPRCGKQTVTRTVARELNQSKKGSWYVEFCSNCDYHRGGFT